MLVRVAGDVSIVKSDSIVKDVLDEFRHFSEANFESTHPCFIRSQLGRILPELARELLCEILQKLEVLSLTQDCSIWHIVFSTFAVLLMAIETIQYQDARIGFHADLDGGAISSPAFGYSARSQVLEQEGVNVLLHFYRVCYGRCNSRLDDTSSPAPTGDSGDFLAKLRESFSKIRPYLDQRSKIELKGICDMSYFFDRLVAKLLLTKPIS